MLKTETIKLVNQLLNYSDLFNNSTSKVKKIKQKLLCPPNSPDINKVVDKLTDQ